ncbi:MAG: 3-oxoacyl-[acyl-carrier-protein] synthase III C-terminal domain-containing protein [Pseudomonadota bacterium]
MPGPLIDNDTLLAALERQTGRRHAALARKIARRLGIRSRHISRDLDEALSGTLADREAPALCATALSGAGASDMSFLIGHTATPHTQLPGNTAYVAEALRYQGPYTELRQACTGFAAALSSAAAMVAEDGEEVVGIVGSETGSPFFNIADEFLDLDQLINYVQMGDGAGAIIVGKDDGAGSRIVDAYYGQIGVDREPGIGITGGGSASPACPAGLPYFFHNSRAVRKHGQALILAGLEAVQSRGYALDDFDWILPHQANGNIDALFLERFPDYRGQVFVTADRLGNLGSAAIWVGLHELRESGKLEAGDRVLVLGAEASKYMFGGFVYEHQAGRDQLPP